MDAPDQQRKNDNKVACVEHDMADKDTLAGGTWSAMITPAPADPDYSAATSLLLELIVRTVSYLW